MLSHFYRKFVPSALAVLALTGCEDETVEFSEVDTETVWSSSYEDYVHQLQVEPGRGDTVVLDSQGVARFDADGNRLFRHVGDQIGIAEAAFTPEGNTLLLGSCFTPTSFAGADVCSELDPAVPTSAAALIELNRNGNVVRTATLDVGSAGGINPQAMSVGAKGQVYFAGSFTGTITLGEETYEAGLVSQFNTPSGLFYAQLDAEWNVTRSRHFGADSGEVSDLAIDPDSGDTFIIGTFSGDVRFNGHNLTNGPSGQAIFLARLDEGDAKWAKHFLGNGSFEARFDAGDIYVYGRGTAPFTSLGGDEVIDGPFATRLSGGDGAHQWTWRAYDDSYGSTATVDAMGRVVAVYTQRTEIKAAVEPREDCYLDYWGPDCEYQSAEYIYHRELMVVAPDGRELGAMDLDTNEYGGGSGLLAPAPDGSVILAEEINPGGGVPVQPGQPQPQYNVMTLSKIRFVE